MMKVNAKRFSLFPYPALDTILKALQSPETQGIKYKKKTITTFRIPSTSSYPKSSQNPTDYMFLVRGHSVATLTILSVSDKGRLKQEQ